MTKDSNEWFVCRKIFNRCNALLLVKLVPNYQICMEGGVFRLQQYLQQLIKDLVQKAFVVPHLLIYNRCPNALL